MSEVMPGQMPNNRQISAERKSRMDVPVYDKLEHIPVGSFGQDRNGNVYLGQGNGTVRKIISAGQ